MKKLTPLFFAVISLGFLLSCNSHNGYTKVVLYTSAPLNSKLYVNLIPFFGDKPYIADSAIIKDNHDSVTLYVPNKVQKIYSIDVKDTRLKVIFITDAPLIRIHANYFSNKYTISGSEASTSLKNFEENQQAKIAKLRPVVKSIDSVDALHQTGKVRDSLYARFNRGNAIIGKGYNDYADTVKSPAAFMRIYNSINFDNDFMASKKFILASAARFRNYQPVQNFAKEVLATIRIYEEEFVVGDKLPAITLPDVNDKLFSTKALQNKYYLIDFWSTLCQTCIPFKIAEKKLSENILSQKLQIVSVAIDDEKDEWRKIIDKNKLTWTQLIDVKMWQGPAVRTLVFDSIPYNFLVSPQGKIIKKAIKPDSLLKVVSELRLN